MDPFSRPKFADILPEATELSDNEDIKLVLVILLIEVRPWEWVLVMKKFWKAIG